MLHMIKNRLECCDKVFYVIFRLVVGSMFFIHGAQKLFGWFGGKAMAIASLMGVAGIVEVIGGLLIFFGLFTRLAALIAAVEMLCAYFISHFNASALAGWIPNMNRGEAALLYFTAFLILLIYGAGSWSLEKLISKKEHF